MRAALATIVAIAVLCTGAIAAVAQETEPMSEDSVMVRGTQQFLDEIGDSGDWTARREGMSDPRLDGEVTFDFEYAYHGEEPPDADQQPHVIWSTFTVTNDEGFWHGRSIGFVDEWNELRQVGWLEGNGAYEGLTFIEHYGFPVPGSGGRADVVGILYAGEVPSTVLPPAVAD
jgi:hypothetical protein